MGGYRSVGGHLKAINNKQSTDKLLGFQTVVMRNKSSDKANSCPLAASVNIPGFWAMEAYSFADVRDEPPAQCVAVPNCIESSKGQVTVKGDKVKPILVQIHFPISQIPNVISSDK